MQNQVGDEEGQQQQDPMDKGHETTHNLTIFGPYERFSTRILDELLKVFPVFAHWLINLALLITPTSEKDLIEGLRENMKEIDGNVAKLIWSLGAPIAAVKFRFYKTHNKKQEQEQEQEI